MNSYFRCCHHTICTDIWVLRLGEGRSHWCNSQDVGSWGVLGCSFQSPPLLTSTGVGILCIKHGNHELVSTSTHIPDTYSVLGFVLGCGHIGIQNDVLAFKELQDIKRDGQIAPVQRRTMVERCESLVLRERSDSEQCGRGWLRWEIVIVPSITVCLAVCEAPFHISSRLASEWCDSRTGWF